MECEGREKCAKTALAAGLFKDCQNCLIQDRVMIATRALRPRNHN